MIRMREVEERLRDKVDPEVIRVIAGIAEYQSTQRQQIKQLAELVNRCIDQVNEMIRVTDVAVQRIDNMKRQQDALFDETHDV